MQRSPRPFLFFIATLIVVALSWPSDAMAQRGHGQARGGGGGGARGATAVSRAAGRGPSGGPQGGHGQVAVPRHGPPPGHGGYYGGYHGHYHPYYGYGWGFYGGFYYPPFYSMWGWYPYPFGYPWYPYWGGPYWGPYDNSASVRLQVTPREAEVYVDGYYAGTVDDFDGTFQRLHVGPGGHKLTIWHAGYRSATEQMYFRPTGSYKVSQTLEKLADGQPNEPKPQPEPGARAHREDDGAYGPPPEGEGDPGAGPRRPEPRWPDPVDSGPRTMPPGEPRVSGQPASFGTLVIRVQPEGAAVTIDGERWQGPAAQDRLVVQLAGGRHHVEIKKDGYVTYSGDVDVHPGDSTPLNVSLPPTDRQ